METILIPRVSTLTKDMEIFSNLAKFSAVTGYIPSVIPTSPFENYLNKRDNRLTSFLRSLRNSVLKKSRADYETISYDEFKYTLFSSETRLELRERKKALVQLVKKHEAALLALREARMKCWKSKDKVEKYRLILETQRSALKYNQDELRIRSAAIKNMEIMFDKWMAIHEKDHIGFKTKFLEEIKYREKIQRISKDIEIDIREMLTESIRLMMNSNKQCVSETDISKLSKQLYSQTSRAYKFTLAQNIPCQKVWIEKSKYENSSLWTGDIKRKIKHADQTVREEKID
ncbi:uncharacterized protein LOC123554690 isoform X3 [Mercenaria mercenaria]|uniref:uncharacterized protein LOC123554690 isoform X3 n=1 Tax=Mercenaria mercenaria TaxID=6596 RepID=UPI00234F74A7|nr:uncharacterized protein LOC123554690 isoform X3 [Mercenaria mercenaria]